MKVLIAGGNATGMSAASKLRRMDKLAEIIVIEKGQDVSYASCGLPYYIENVFDDPEMLRIRASEEFRNKLDIQIRMGEEMVGLSPTEKNISVKKKNGETYTESYDKLVIGTGASPIVPPFPGRELDNIYVLKTIDDSIDIKRSIQNEGVKTVTIVGSGFIGIELAESFLMQGKKVRIIEMASRVMGPFEPEITDALENELKENGVELCLNESVQSFIGNGKVTEIKTDKGIYSTDLVVISVGNSPNTKFLREVEGLKFLKNGALIVNSKMETGVSDVYAGGDCASVYNEITKEQAYIALGTNANKQGKIIGTILGGEDRELPGRLGSSAIKFMGLEAAKIGAGLKEAEKAGYNAGFSIVRTTLVPGYYSNQNNVLIKLVFDKDSRKILGVCMIGKYGTVLRANIFATAITAGMTIEDISNLDLAYSPPFSHPWDAVHVAANATK